MPGDGGPRTLQAMDPAALFRVLNLAVLPAWLLIVAAPRWKGTQAVVHAVWIPVLLGLVYGSLLLAAETPEGAGFGSLDGVRLFFQDPHALLAGWVHYLVFDLFVGAWESRDAARRGISAVWVAPCLLLTLMLGPLGLLAYLVLRFAQTRSGTLVEAG